MVLVLLEFRNGQMVPCKFKCPQCASPLQFDANFELRIGSPEPKLLADSPSTTTD